MQTIKTNGREIVAVEVPAYASEFYLSNGWYLCHRLPKREFVYTQQNEPILLTDCKIIGLLSELTVEQIRMYVSPELNDIDEIFLSTKEIFINRLNQYNLDTTKPLLIIEKLK